MAGAEDVGTHGVNPSAGRDANWLLQLRAKTRWELAFLIWEPFEGRAQVSTYVQFQDRMLRVAAGRRKRGVKAGDCVLVHRDNSPELELRWFACARLGAVVVTTAVVAQQHPMLEVPVAFVLVAPRIAALARADLSRHIIAARQAKLADFKGPRQVFVVADLPRSTLEKIHQAEPRKRLPIAG
jgi:acyl-coenzyme A synthetase/AMP-(fatty) acid ligase